MQPGLLYPEENQQLPTCDPIMPTSPIDLLVSVRDVELEEKDTEDGYKVQLDDLTDRVIVRLM